MIRHPRHPGGRPLLTALSLAFLVAAPAWAGPEVIDFDEPAAANTAEPLAEEYARQGVHFFSMDDAVVRGGIPTGGPEGWQVEGTRGPRFLGFDGASYSAVLTFDETVTDFRLDLTRAAPHPFIAHRVRFAALLEGRVVDEQIVYLGAVDSWSEVSMADALDQVVIEGPGFNGTRFAIDNVRWTAPDVEDPGGSPSIEARMSVRAPRMRRSTDGGEAVYPVFLFGSEQLDVRSIDLDSLDFGPGLARFRYGNRRPVGVWGRDRYKDLFLRFVVDAEVAPAVGESVCLVGRTRSGESFEACREVRSRRWTFESHLRRRRHGGTRH